MSPDPAGYLIANVRVLHNEERDGERWVSIIRGYVAETADLREVFALRVAEPMAAGDNLDAALLAICEHVYLVTNADFDVLNPTDEQLARQYRAKQVRSLSVGDVVLIELPDATHAFTVAVIGMQPIATPVLATT